MTYVFYLLGAASASYAFKKGFAEQDIRGAMATYSIFAVLSQVFLRMFMPWMVTIDDLSFIYAWHFLIWLIASGLGALVSYFAFKFPRTINFGMSEVRFTALYVTYFTILFFNYLSFSAFNSFPYMWNYVLGFFLAILLNLIFGYITYVMFTTYFSEKSKMLEKNGVTGRQLAENLREGIDYINPLKGKEKEGYMSILHANDLASKCGFHNTYQIKWFFGYLSFVDFALFISSIFRYWFFTLFQDVMIIFVTLIVIGLLALFIPYLYEMWEGYRLDKTKESLLKPDNE